MVDSIWYEFTQKPIANLRNPNYSRWIAGLRSEVLRLQSAARSQVLPMFDPLQPCTSREITAQVDYLADTPVSALANYLSSGKLILFKSCVRSLQTLGAIKTEFGQIGPLAPSSSGEPKFLVSELVPTLRANPAVDDGGLLERICAFMEAVRLGRVEFNVTLLAANSELVIKDGNKRSIAFHETRKEDGGRDTIEFPIFVLHVPSNDKLCDVHQ